MSAVLKKFRSVLHNGVIEVDGENFLFNIAPMEMGLRYLVWYGNNKYGQVWFYTLPYRPGGNWIYVMNGTAMYRVCLDLGVAIDWQDAEGSARLETGRAMLENQEGLYLYELCDTGVKKTSFWAGCTGGIPANAGELPVGEPDAVFNDGDWTVLNPGIQPGTRILTPPKLIEEEKILTLAQIGAVIKNWHPDILPPPPPPPEP